MYIILYLFLTFALPTAFSIESSEGGDEYIIDPQVKGIPKRGILENHQNHIFVEDRNAVMEEEASSEKKDEDTQKNEGK